jgi:epoxyqueuosine reductase
VSGALDSPFVKAAALRAGFHDVGVARAEVLEPGALDRVLAEGWEAGMAWLRTQRAERLDPSRLLPGAKSVVALALSYRAAEPGPPGPGEGEVARFARGRDYHAVMKRKLKALVLALTARDPGLRAFASSDLAPTMEKAWAQRAGLGWVGKNGCLITPTHGSWVLLATLLLDRELEPDPPHPERCGSCEACLPACPTGAIPAPGFVDSRRCLSFWTIERRGAVPGEMAARLGSHLFGCDDCQTCCPWNGATPLASDPELAPREGQSAIPLEGLLRLDQAEYARRFHGTSLARARFDGLVRNALLVAAGTGDRRWRPLVAPWLASHHDGVRAAAAWAMARLGESD